MLRVHFLNVGHGDCTIISHPSGRLTMIDINNSQDYDSESFKELVKEERQKVDALRVRQAGLGSLFSQGSLMASGLALNPLRGAGAFGAQPNALLGAYDSVYADAARDAASELTDPIEFLQKTYPGRSLFRFILTHPDLDHMRGLKRLHDTVGFANFWDTRHTKPDPDFRSDADREDWEFYRSLRSNDRTLRITAGAMRCLPSVAKRTELLAATTSRFYRLPPR